MCEIQIPHKAGDWLRDRMNPSQLGQWTGRISKAGNNLMLELRYPDCSTKRRPLSVLESAKGERGSLRDQLKAGLFGKPRDFERVMTFEKLKGNLHDVIYSMEAARIDFLAYQFKPVLKFINSPTERLIIADEVGLGKTIESALIWMELQARRRASRLLVICPSILTEKWRNELRGKFQLDARIAKFADVKQEIKELKQSVGANPFVLISSYEQMRSPKDELDLIEKTEEPFGSDKTQFLWEMRHWKERENFNAFDLVIFDEAHYMRNSGTANFHLGKSLSASDGAVLCVSATPVHNSNKDLHSLMKLIDEDFLKTKGVAEIETLLKLNQPVIQAANALHQTPMNRRLLQEAIKKMEDDSVFRELAFFKQFQKLCKHLNPNDGASLAEAEALLERLNLLGNYVNRTRRKQVKKGRALRQAVVLSVEYTKEEMQLYQKILKLVRQQCLLEDREFHIFRQLVLQLRAASCLPVVSDEIRNGRLINLEDCNEMIEESIYSTSENNNENEINNKNKNKNENEYENESKLDLSDLKGLLEYDFEANDTKFAKLIEMLHGDQKKEKVVIFSFYKKTLEYLHRRLLEEGMKKDDVEIIHGGVKNEDRWEAIDHFQKRNGARVLLSSEVGSEGIDLQFCRIVVNYDLPWNPMRVEQRIGRIDRVGQKAKLISIVNFKVKGTVEERLYDRLHSKVENIAINFGDFEAIVGKEIRKLTIDLLRKDLTPKEEEQRIEQTKLALAFTARHEKELEDEGDVLMAHADYLEKKVRESRSQKRYIQPEDLVSYVKDFFDREFRGCEVHENTPAPHCLNIRLSNEAKASLDAFIGHDYSIGARPFLQQTFCLTFDHDLFDRNSPKYLSAYDQQKVKQKVNFVNHQSPLIKWITKINRDRADAFHNVSAMQLRRFDDLSLPSGDYAYRIERWELIGISPRKNLAYGIASLDGERILDGSESEKVVRHLLRNGEDWDRIDGSIKSEMIAHEVLERDLQKRFDEAVNDFEAENEMRFKIGKERARNYFDGRIDKLENTLQKMKNENRKANIIRATDGRLRVAKENKERRLRDLERQAETDFTPIEVAAGVFRILDL